MQDPEIFENIDSGIWYDTHDNVFKQLVCLEISIIKHPPINLIQYICLVNVLKTMSHVDTKEFLVE